YTRLGRGVFFFDTGAAAVIGVTRYCPAFGPSEQVGPEGCLSIPGVRYDVRRAARVRVSGVDVTGAPVEFEADGLLARCVQHEYDHLDGVLFINRLEPADRKDAMRTIRESDWFRGGITVRESSGVGGGR
ncbi:peptide deformylase, partial [Nocardia fluminea]|uniref:peptide deformylase n=1 Tax=Nocardia fluminea TaxID=134984 RepID=UPI00366F495B